LGMSRRPIEFQLSREDQQTLRELLRAIVLEQLAAGHTAPAVARIVHLAPQAVWHIAYRYRQGGIARSLFERQGRGAKQPLRVAEKQPIIATVCSPPRPGLARWTVRLIAAEAVRRKLVSQVGRRPSECCCATTSSSRGGKKCGAWRA
jgi:Homeodomain-like domain-containing protein